MHNTLFRELLNKHGQSYQLTFGDAFWPQGDPEMLAAALRSFVTEEMPRGARRFDPNRINAELIAARQ